MSDPVLTLEVEMAEPRPISVNEAYSSNGAKRFLTSAGKKYKASLVEIISNKILLLPHNWQDLADVVYKYGGHVTLDVTLYLDNLRNTAWRVGGGMTKGGEKGSKPKPRSPFVSKDASNYVKLIEDAVKDATGIDDSCHLDVIARKREDLENPRVHIIYSIFE